MNRDVIIGYRVWYVTNGHLRSVVAGTTWPFRQRLEAPQPPHEMGDLGIYAYRESRAALEWFAHIRKARRDLAVVAGTVKLWGVVLAHDLGYRAQFAYPVELWLPDECGPLTAMTLEESYGVTTRWLT